MPNTDAFPVTAGSGRNVMVDHDLTAPDTTANVDAQIIKILAGKSQTVTGLTGGRYVDGGSTSADAVALFTDPRVDGADVQKNPTISTSAYTVGWSLGGVLDFGAIARANSVGLLITSASILDKSQKNAAIDLFLFNANPTNGTYTDHAAITTNATDLAMIRGVISFGAYANLSTTESVCSVPNVGLHIVPNATTHLYGLMIIRTAVTYVGTTDIFVNLTYVPD